MSDLIDHLQGENEHLRAKLQAAEAHANESDHMERVRWEELQDALREKLMLIRRAEAAEAETRNERERLIALLLYEGTDAVCTDPVIHHDLKIVSMGFDEKKLRRLINGKD